MKSPLVRLSILAFVFLSGSFATRSAPAQLDDRPVQAAGVRPALLRDVGLDQKLGNSIPLAQAVGFRYAYDSASGQFAHPSGIMLLTSAGKLTRYFYGISYPSRDLRLGLVEASQGKIGSPIDQILLYCYHYDPATGKYGLLIARVIQAAGVLTVLSLGLVIAILFRRENYVLPRRDP